MRAFKPCATYLFPCLKQWSLCGTVQDIAEQIDAWHLPSLNNRTILELQEKQEYHHEYEASPKGILLTFYNGGAYVP